MRTNPAPPGTTTPLAATPSLDGRPPVEARPRVDAGPTASASRRRSELHLAARQLQAITRFNDARRMAEGAAAAVARSREMRMDVARSLDVLRREHDAVVRRAHEQLRLTGTLLQGAPGRRVVIAHRNEWFTAKVADALQDRGVVVVATVDNGADAIGISVAEQPDLLIVEDTLAMVPGEQVVRDVLSFCPDTVVAAQVAYSDRVDPLRQAGAAAVFTRQVPPLDAVRQLLELLAAA